MGRETSSEHVGGKLVIFFTTFCTSSCFASQINLKGKSYEHHEAGTRILYNRLTLPVNHIWVA